MKPVRVGICGLGTVGSGTFNVLSRNRDVIAGHAGSEIIIEQIGARRDNPNCPVGSIPVTRDIFAVAENPNVDIVVELIGGTTTARELVLRAINNGKHVVTANKALIAQYGNEIFAAAQARGVSVAFEAAVAGGIPVIKAIREGLAANRIEWLAGIINGTSNFILTEMREKGRAFADVLKEAQALGYAEADPTFDVEGIDAAHKLMILAAIAFGIPLQFNKIYTEGITKITPMDVEYAEQLGYRIKHAGHCTARRQRHRIARAPDADSGKTSDRQRQRRDERRVGQRRCRRSDPVLRCWRRRGANGFVGGRRHHRCGAHADMPTRAIACRIWRSSPMR